MARAIDSDWLKNNLNKVFRQECDQLYGMLQLIDEAPTLTPQNEPLTLISMMDEMPPDNERVLVYRPCMVDSDTGPYSVQWGWAAKRDGSHWARLPGRRPPEGEGETCAGCVYENNEHEECNYCRRAAYLSDYYYRPPEEEI